MSDVPAPSVNEQVKVKLLELKRIYDEARRQKVERILGEIWKHAECCAKQAIWPPNFQYSTLSAGTQSSGILETVISELPLRFGLRASLQSCNATSFTIQVTLS